MELIELPQSKLLETVPLRVLFDKKITSKQPDFRLQLRSFLLAELKQQGATPPEDVILNLTSRPRAEGFSISLSHSVSGSVMALAPGEFPLGVDVEKVDRLYQALIDRISSFEEQLRCPVPSSLFSSKEAAWKALNERHQLMTISQLETHHWKELEDGWLQFNVSANGQPLNGFGFVREFSGTYLSFFLDHSTFG